MEKKIEEKWLPVPEFEALYEVSNLGNVRSLDRTTAHNYGGKVVKKGRLLKRYLCSIGYWEVGLTKDQKTKTIRVHRLVGRVHVPNPRGFKVLNHIDGDKQNASASNLEWCTQSHNCKQAYDNGLAKKHSLARLEGLKKSAVKRQKQVVILNVITMESWTAESIRKAAEFIGVTASCISHGVKNNRTILNDFKVSLALPNPGQAG